MSIEIELCHRLNQDFLLEIVCQLPNVQVLGIFGKSGSGKTTLLNMMTGLLQPQQGKIKIKDVNWLCTETGINIPVRKRGIGYAFQAQRLFPHLSVKSNIFYSKRPVAKWLPENGLRAIDQLGILHLLNRMPQHLSGGEKQRVSLAQALISSQQLLLLDEPTTGLDKNRKENFFQIFESYKKNSIADKPIVFYVSHYLDELIQIADHLMILEQGKMTAIGSKEVMLQKYYNNFGLKNPLNLITVQALSHDMQNQKTLIQIGGNQLSIPLNQDFLLDQPTSVYIDGSLIPLVPALTSSHLSIQPKNHDMKGRINKITSTANRVCRVEMNIGQFPLSQNPSILHIMVPSYKISDCSLSEGQEVHLFISQMTMENGAVIFC